MATTRRSSFAQGDHAAFADALAHLLTDRDAAAARARRGRVLVEERLHWEREERVLLARYESFLGRAAKTITRSEGSATILCAMPFFWIGGVLAAMGALHEPVTLLVMPRLDAGTALDLAERERATGIVGWPAFTQRLREHPSFAGRDLSSAPMLREGPLDIAMTDVPDGFPVHRTMSETAGGFAFTEISIVDEDGQPVPDGTAGELLIRGIGAMAGYNKRERWETFDDDGWYHTGDRVYRRADDPRLFYVGRTSELIKSAGANVSPIEVEAVIEQFPEWRSAWSSGSTTRSGVRKSVPSWCPRQRNSISMVSRRILVSSCPPTRFRPGGSSRQVSRFRRCRAANWTGKRCVRWSSTVYWVERPRRLRRPTVPPTRPGREGAGSVPDRQCAGPAGRPAPRLAA